MAERPHESIRWLFLLNVLFVAAASLPLLVAYPAVFARLGIPSLENGFFVRLSAAWLFVEAIASFLVWRRLAVDARSTAAPQSDALLDLVWVIVAMKVAFILLVVGAAIAGSLPAPAFVAGAAIDLAFSIVFLLFINRQRAALPAS